ncbi:hypothetical protein K469DRAFT_147797 [Zopfia rhizophila CBS 207.26]|uniref:Uncharacterized protein n=1 Tax=Zopfia rhizophila CBS 207.26 TaxID=1314779 RepID=A0A6A6E4Y8_9PEZI|nr:hypothetical protein K469DRAFT_147797 [Zopfia rhizophila CBS 207.26]
MWTWIGRLTPTIIGTGNGGDVINLTGSSNALRRGGIQAAKELSQLAAHNQRSIQASSISVASEPATLSSTTGVQASRSDTTESTAPSSQPMPDSLLVPLFSVVIEQDYDDPLQSFNSASSLSSSTPNTPSARTAAMYKRWLKKGTLRYLGRGARIPNWVSTILPEGRQLDEDMINEDLLDLLTFAQHDEVK